MLLCPALLSWAPGVLTGSQNTLQETLLGEECPPRAPLPPVGACRRAWILALGRLPWPCGNLRMFPW